LLGNNCGGRTDDAGPRSSGQKRCGSYRRSSESTRNAHGFLYHSIQTRGQGIPSAFLVDGTRPLALSFAVSNQSDFVRSRMAHGQKPAAHATRGSGAKLATDGKPHCRAESRRGHGPRRRCTHDPEMRFPARRPGAREQ